MFCMYRNMTMTWAVTHVSITFSSTTKDTLFVHRFVMYAIICEICLTRNFSGNQKLRWIMRRFIERYFLQYVLLTIVFTIFVYIELQYVISKMILTLPFFQTRWVTTLPYFCYWSNQQTHVLKQKGYFVIFEHWPS